MSDIAAAPSQTPMLHDCVIQRNKKAAQARIMPVPPEECGFGRATRTLADCNYAYHKPPMTEGKAIAQGYDATQIKALPTWWGGSLASTEEQERDSVAEGQYGPADTLNTAARPIELIEHYIRMDYEGKGDLKLYKVTTGGADGQILRKEFDDDDQRAPSDKKSVKEDIEEFDMMPFAAMTPVIITHRFFGRSIADLVMEIQKIKTALLRGALDNTYFRNTPRVEVAENLAGPNTLDDLLVARPSGIVRVKAPGGISWQEVPDVASTTLPVIEYMDMTREWRTGVTRQGQGIDANALQNQTATAVNQLYTMAQARVKLIARIFAETGIKDLFILLHVLIRKHGQEAQTVRLRNQWVEVDPRDWKTRNDLTVHVGIGDGGQQEQMAAANAVGAAQEKMLMGGMSDVVSKKNVYSAAKLLCRALKLKNVDAYFTDPASPEGQQAAAQLAQASAGKVDPKVQVEQMQIQADQAKDQRQAQLQQQKMQMDQQHQIAKNSADAAVAQKKHDLDVEKAVMDFRLKSQEAERQHVYKLQEFAIKAHEADQNRAAKAQAQDGQERGTAAVHQGIGTLSENLQKMAEQHQQLMATIAQPKRRVIGRDEQGRATHADEVPVQ